MSVRLALTLGKCCVLMIKDFVKYQPEGFSDEDVYVCESRYLHKYKSIKKIKVSYSCASSMLMSSPTLSSHGAYLLANSLSCCLDPPPSHSLECRPYLLANSSSPCHHSHRQTPSCYQWNQNQSLNRLRMRLLVLIVTRVIIALLICPSLTRQRYFMII